MSYWKILFIVVWFLSIAMVVPICELSYFNFGCLGATVSISFEVLSLAGFLKVLIVA